MAPLTVDPMALDGAGSSVVSIGKDLESAISTLTSKLAGTAGMCGDDPAGAELARKYDSTAKALIDAMTQVRNGLCRIGDGVRASAANYSAAEAGSNIAGGMEPLPRPAVTEAITAGSVPSGAGRAAPAPPGWGWVAPFIGMIWPTADSGRLRAAAAAWTAAGAQFLATEVGAAGPLGVVGAQHIPEGEAIGVAFAAAARAGGEVLQQCAAIANTLTTYAAQVDAAHAAILNLLSQIVDPMTGIRIVWDFLTDDDEKEIKRIANEIRTLVDTLNTEASALANQIAGLAAEATITAANMTMYANKEWDHFLHDTAAGRVVDQIGQYGKGAWEEAGGILKTVGWTYNPNRILIDPEGSWHDYQDLGRGLAPLVGLGGENAPGVGQAWKDLGKSAVHWDEWSKNPAEAAGRSVIDIATLFIPGAGEEAAGIRSARVAADAADAARVERTLGDLAPKIPEVPKPPAEVPKPPAELPKPPAESPKPAPVEPKPPPFAHETPTPTPGQSAADARLPAAAERPVAATPRVLESPVAKQAPLSAASPHPGELSAGPSSGPASAVVNDVARVPPPQLTAPERVESPHLVPPSHDNLPATPHEAPNHPTGGPHHEASVHDGSTHDGSKQDGHHTHNDPDAVAADPGQAALKFDPTTPHSIELGTDHAIGGRFRETEAQTAWRVETERGVYLKRFPERGPDWFDPATGETYDGVGNFDAAIFESQWDHLQEVIVDHLGKAHYVPVDISKFTHDQCVLVKEFIEKLGTDRVFVVGDH